MAQQPKVRKGGADTSGKFCGRTKVMKLAIGSDSRNSKTQMQ